MSQNTVTQPQARHKSVSYRLGSFTSKISVQPALYEAICKKIGDRNEGYQWLSQKAALAKSKNIKKISAYAQEQGYMYIIPHKYFKGYVSNLEYQEVRVFVGNIHTTVTMPSIFMHYVEAKFGGKDKANELFTKLANHFSEAKGDSKSCDTSFLIRETIIASII
jgi:hypothetical protein